MQGMHIFLNDAYQPLVVSINKTETIKSMFVYTNQGLIEQEMFMEHTDDSQRG